VPFGQFQLNKKLLHIKMEICERNSFVRLPLLQRMRPLEKNSLNTKGNQITKVMDIQLKDEIIIGCLPQKILSLQNNFCYTYIMVSFLWVCPFLASQFSKADEMERDNGQVFESGISSLYHKYFSNNVFRHQVQHVSAYQWCKKYFIDLILHC